MFNSFIERISTKYYAQGHSIIIIASSSIQLKYVNNSTKFVQNFQIGLQCVNSALLFRGNCPGQKVPGHLSQEEFLGGRGCCPGIVVQGGIIQGNTSMGEISNGQLPQEHFMGFNFLGDNFPRANVRRVIALGAISQRAIVPELVVQGELFRDNFPWGNCPRVNLKGAIVRGALAQGRMSGYPEVYFFMRQKSHNVFEKI